MIALDTLTRGSMRVSQPGPPESFHWVEDVLETPGAMDLVVRHEAIGLNYHDIYVRSGDYSTMAYPGVPGIEASGVVEWVGGSVADISVGDRIAYVAAGYGAYATRRVLSAALALPLPGDVTHEIAAAALLKGLTADMLLTRLKVLEPGAVVVVHAAAGGVGQILTQMAKSLGLTVVAGVGSSEKAALVRDLGCDQVVIYGKDDLGDCVRDLTNGTGVDMVFDGVGAATFDASLSCLKPFGHLALFGQASGPVAAVEFARLAARSLSVSRPVVFHHVSDSARYRRSGGRLFALIASGAIRVQPPHTYPLRDAATAHRALENGLTTGSTIFLPQP
ncbi:MAG: alcohol dehydrogenase [Bradyrhizobium sp.]|nr:alcohol dehydrogenase [Bradyrhizobium sp.]